MKGSKVNHIAIGVAVAIVVAVLVFYIAGVINILSRLGKVSEDLRQTTEAIRTINDDMASMISDFNRMYPETKHNAPSIRKEEVR